MTSDLQCSDNLVSRLVLPYIKSISSICALYGSNKKWSMQLTEQGGMARLNLTDLVAEMTNFPGFKFVPEQIKARLAGIKDRYEFVSEVRSLVCPWTNYPTMLRPNPRNHCDLVFKAITDDDKRLIFHTIEPTLAFPGGNGTVEVSCSATPCETFADTIVRRPLTTEMLLESTIVTEAFMHENVIQEKLLQMLDMHAYTGFSKKYMSFKFVPIHGAVFAVMAFYEVPDPYGAVNRCSVYFFSLPEGRMLLHTLIPLTSNVKETVLLSRPGQLWIMTCNAVTYYGRDLASKAVRLSYKSERIAEAFYVISKGDVDDAIRITKRLECSLDTSQLTNYRTLLHHAVMSDQPAAVHVLLSNKANPCLEDACRMTPLELACFMFHSDCVAVLTQAQAPEDDEEWKRMWMAAWKRICDPDTLKICIQDRRDMEGYYLRMSIPATVAALWTRIPIMDQHDEMSCIMRGYRSTTILHSKKALEFLMTHNPKLVTRFSNGGGFKSVIGYTSSLVREQAMLDSLRMAVLRFGLDINSVTGITKENHIVWAVRMGSLKTVKVLIQELKADLKSRSSHGDSLLRLAMTRASSESYRDVHGKDILHFLTNDVEHVFEKIVMRLNSSGWTEFLDVPMGVAKTSSLPDPE
jgi:hypothetical protein